MKKFGALLAGLLLAGSLMVTAVGCGNTDTTELKAEDVIAQVNANMDEMKAVSMSLDVGLDMTNNLLNENNQMQMGAKLDLTMKQDPLQLHMSGDVSGMGGLAAKTEVYLVPEGDDFVGYMGVTDGENNTQWLKKTVDEEQRKELERSVQEQIIEANGDSMLDITSLTEKALSMEISGRETVNGVNALVIDSQLNMEDFLKAMEKAEMDGLVNSMVGSNEDAMKLYKDVTLPFKMYINEKEMVLTRCEIDLKTTMETLMKNMLSAYMTSSDSELEGINVGALLTIDQAEVVINVTGFNDTVKDIVVPNDVKKNATDAGKLETSSLPLLGGTTKA